MPSSSDDWITAAVRKLVATGMVFPENEDAVICILYRYHYEMHGYTLPGAPKYTAGGNAAFMEFSKPGGGSAGAGNTGCEGANEPGKRKADSPAPVCKTCDGDGYVGHESGGPQGWVTGGPCPDCAPAPVTCPKCGNDRRGTNCWHCGYQYDSPAPVKDEPVDVGAYLIRMHIRAKEACSTGGAIANEQGDYEYVKRQFRRLAAERDEFKQQAFDWRAAHVVSESAKQRAEQRADRWERLHDGRTEQLKRAERRLENRDACYKYNAQGLTGDGDDARQWLVRAAKEESDDAKD